MELMLDAVMESLNKSLTLLASPAQRLGVMEQEGLVATTVSFATDTTPRFVQDRVQETKLLSSSSISTHRVMSDGALHVDDVLAPDTPTRCSTFVLTSPQKVSVAGAQVVNTDQSRSNAFPRFDGTNPGLWREKCLEYFTKFDICKPFWTTAARMHMDGKAKDWLEAYRLRQVVGDWFEFMDAVEANFGVCDFHQKLQEQLLPSETPIVGATPLSIDGIPNMSVSMAGEADVVHMLSDDMQEWISEHPFNNAPHDTYEQQMASLGDMDHLAESLVKEDSQEILTDIGSSSLFLEHVMDVADTACDGMLLNEVCMSDDVLTHFSGISLFLEPCVDTAAEAFSGMLLMDMTWDREIRDHALTYINCSLVFLERSVHHRELEGSGDTTNSVDHVWSKMPPWRLSGFSPGKCEHPHDLHLDIMWLYGIAKLWDPGISTAQVNIVHPGMFEVKGDFVVLSRVSPWDRSVFSMWLGNNTPPDNMQLSLVCLSTKYMHDTLLCLLLAIMEGKKACALQCIKTLNFNEIFLVEEAGYRLSQIIHEICSTPAPVRQLKHDITSCCTVRLKIQFLFRALIRVLPNEKYDKFKQAIHGNVQPLECEWEISLLSTQTWHPICKHYLFSSIAQPSANFSCSFDAEMIPSANYVLLQYSFQFLASARCTCSFSHWKTFCSRHQGDIMRAVLRSDAFKGIASEHAEYSIKLGTQTNSFGIQDFCSVATSANKLQYMTWDPGIYLSVCAISLVVSAAGARDGASFMRRLHCGFFNYIGLRLRHGQGKSLLGDKQHFAGAVV